MSRLGSEYFELAFLSILVIFSLIAAPAMLAQSTGASNGRELDLSTIVSRMEQARAKSMASEKAYTTVREYNLYGSSESDRKSHVVAEVEFVPPTRKDYAIKQVEGSDRGETIVRRLLQTEAEAAQSANSGKCPGALISANYNFQLLGEETLDGHSVYVLGLKPKHEVLQVVDGKAYVDKNTFLVRRIEGDLAKNPSWWVKKVHTVVDFGDEQGMWLQKSSRSTALIRIFGPHIFTGTTLSLSTATESAKNSAPSLPEKPAEQTARQKLARRRHSNPSVVLGAGVLAR